MCCSSWLWLVLADHPAHADNPAVVCIDYVHVSHAGAREVQHLRMPGLPAASGVQDRCLGQRLSLHSRDELNAQPVLPDAIFLQTPGCAAVGGFEYHTVVAYDPLQLRSQKTHRIEMVSDMGSDCLVQDTPPLAVMYSSPSGAKAMGSNLLATSQPLVGLAKWIATG